MACCTPCAPSCAVPSCASAPVVGLGGCGGIGYGSGFGYGGVGGFAGYGFGASVAASSLGVLPGITPSSINQIPSSEVTVQPPPVVLTIPGPILSATCQPVAVGGYTPCASGPFGSLGSARGGLGGICGTRRICSPC